MANATELLAQFAKLPIGSGVSHWRATPVQAGPSAEELLRDAYVGAAAKDAGQPYERQVYDSNPLNTGVTEAIGSADYRRDRYAYRPDDAAVTDTLSGVGLGAFNTLGGLAALGVGLVNDNAGATVSGWVKDTNEYVRDRQSDGLNARRNASQGRAAAYKQNDDKASDLDKSNYSGFVAGMRRIGREAMSAVSNAADDPTMLTDGLAEATGSLVTGGPLFKAGGLIGRAAIRGLLGRGVISEAAALKAAQVGSKAGMPALIGSMEAGGSYQQTVQQIMDMGHDELLSASPEYRDLIAQGWSENDAKAEIATSAGLTAAAIQFPVAAAAGTLVSKFEANPFKGATAPLGVLKNGATEAIEEAIQSGGGQLAGNVGIREFALPGQDLLEGVGEQAGLGALYGFGSAVGTQGTGTAIGGAVTGAGKAVEGAKAIGNKAVEAFDKRLTSVKEGIDQLNPVSKDNINTAVEQTLTEAPAVAQQVQADVEAGTLTPEQGDAIKQRLNTLQQSIAFDPVEIEDRDLSPAVKSVIGSATNKFDALQKAAQLAGSKQVDVPSRIEAALYINDTLNKFGAQLIGDLTSAIDIVPDDHASLPKLREFEDVLINFQQNPELQQARQAAQQYVERMQAEALSEQAVATPKGQQAVRGVVSVAESNPESVSEDLANLVLEHARMGRVKLTPQQTRVLTNAAVLSKTGNTYKLEAKKRELKPTDIVRAQVLTDEMKATPEAKGEALSLAQHVRGINDAYRASNLELAAQRLKRLSDFAQHFQNKVAALNTAYATGANSDRNAVEFEGLSLKGAWGAKGRAWISPTKVGSIKLAQSVALEAKALADMANGMAQSMPELGIGPVTPVELNPDLVGPSTKVAQRFQNAPEKAPTKLIELEETAKVEPTQAQPSKAQTGSVAPKAEVTETVAPSPTETVAEKANPEPVKTEAVDKTVDEVSTEPVETAPAVEPVEAPESPDRASDQESTKAETQTEEAKAEPEQEAKPVTIEQAYPNLFETDKVKNWFRRAYKFPKEVRSRLVGKDSPLSFISEAVQSNDTYSKLLEGKSTKTLTADVAKAYADFLAVGSDVFVEMDKSLEKFLDSAQNKKEGITFRDALTNGLSLDSGNQVNGFPRGKALNIVEQNEDGSFSYNEQLVESAILAGLQWMVTAKDRMRELDAEEVAKITGLTEAEATEHVNFFNDGLWRVAAKRDLANLITRYWGVQGNREAPEGYVRGIAEGVASEVLRGLQASGMLIEDGRKIDGKDHVLFRFTDEAQDHFDKIAAFPSAIEEAVLIEPENVNFIGTPPSEVATNQLHGSPVPLLDQQKQALEAAQNTPFTLNLNMLSFLEMLGEEGVLALFGKGDPTGRGLLKKTAETIKGYNQTVMSGYKHLTNLVREMDNVADTAGTKVEELPVFFRYGISSVGRMQMQGRASPQASKLVREVLLPTWSTLDLSQVGSEHHNAFMLAVGQHIGVKVHKLKPDQAIEKTMDELGTKYAGIVEMISQWLATEGAETWGQVEIDQIKSVLGNKVAPGALHAVMEYARYLNDLDGRKAFRTGLYLEADGVTDGPVNALMNLVAGKFTPAWLDLMNRGGMYLGSNPVSLADYVTRSKDSSEDLYQKTTNFLYEHLSSLWDKLSSNSRASEMSNMMGDLFIDLLPDVRLEDGQVKFERGIAKNPLTVTVYGSGVRGIASKLTAGLLEELYDRLSTGEQLLPQTERALRVLTTTKLTRKFGKYNAVRVEGINLNTGSGVDFELTKDMIKILEDNVMQLFARPLTGAVREIMGDALETATTLRMATQAQSIFFKYAYRQAIADAIANKDGSDGTLGSDFLSQAELDQIFKDLQKKFPMINTGTQMIWVGGSVEADIEQSEFGGALDGGLRSPGYTYGPENSGVSGIPFIVIATGDGQMILNALTGEQAPQGTLPVFDGINMKLDTIKPDSEQINKAVYDGWAKNPVRALQQSFARFMANLDVSNISDEMDAELEQAFRDGEDFTYIDAEFHLNDVAEQLENAANELDARKAVLAKVNMSVDHMASAAAPFTKTDGVELPADPAKAEKILNEMYAEELAKVTKKKPEPKAEVSEDISAALGSIGTLHSSGARIISRDAIRQIVGELNIPLDQRGLLRSSVNALATKGWTVLHGTPEQLIEYARENGLKVPYGFNDSNGMVLPADKVMFLTSANSETLTHEFLHAATVQLIHAYYSGNGQVAKAVPDAVKRLELLMADFLAIDPSTIDDRETRVEFMFVKEQINKFDASSMSDANIKTGKLSEFMAWTLSNEKLSDLARKTQVKSKLALIADKVLETLKKLWRQVGLAPTPRDDIYSNVRFNTLLLMENKQKSVLDPASVTSMAQFQARNYGGSDRLIELEKSFARKMLAALPAEPTQRFRIDQKYEAMHRMAGQVRKTFQSNGFAMNQKEASFFETLVMALAVDKTLNANAQSRAEEVFREVLSKLKVEDFMEDPDSQDQYDRQQANLKFNTVVGNAFVGRDLSSRTMLMPAFLALAMVYEPFRNALSKMDLPKFQKSSESTLDALLSDLGNEGLDRLGRTLSGEGKSDNVLDAVEALTRKLAEIQSEREAFIETHIDAVGNTIDKTNNFVVDQMNRLSREGYDRLQDVVENSDNKYARGAARAAAAVVSFFNEDISGANAEFALKLSDKSTVWKPLRELLVEVIGRTEENAPIYDMIKAVRSYIQQTRQIYRERLPKFLSEKFSRKLSKQEWSGMYHVMAKTDLAAVASLGSKRVLDMLRDAGKLRQETVALERQIDKLDSVHSTKLKSKARELAEYMMLRKVSSNLLTNAESVANLYGELTVQQRNSRGVPKKALIQAIDQLATLYALDLSGARNRQAVAELAAKETAGVEFMLNYLKGQRQNELDKARSGRAQVNHIKGYVPTEIRSGASLIVAPDLQHNDLVARGYTRVAPYKGSAAEGPSGSQSYYFAPLSARAQFNQGIAQNVRSTFSGVDPTSGFSIENYGLGRITNQEAVRKITSRIRMNHGSEALIPIRDEFGDVVAYERTLDPAQLAKLEREEDLSKVLGIWRGRQLEEASADQFNQILVERLHDMWDKRSVGDEEAFVDLFDPKSHNDPVIADAVKLLTPQMRRHIENAFGGEGFMVRKSMVNDVIGYRSASIGDLWTGVTRVPPETAKVAANVLTAVMGKDAYKYLVTGEKLWQNFVSDARTTIVVRSVIVPASNMISNVYQLASRGVPLKDILRGMPKKLAEIQAYHENHQKEIKLEAELLSVQNDPTKSRALKAQIQSLKDGHRRLSIWPLIAAGEFSSVSEATVMREESTLFEGKVTQYMESLVDKLPDSVRTAGRYAIISRDTALFQGLQRAVEYGDFLAKAVLYDDLTKRQGMDKDKARAKVSEEFVNYDRLPGRFRGTLENMGLIWFWHFKLRAIKIAMSTLRNNPLHFLMAAAVPAPDFFGSVGLPVTDNALAVAAEGKLNYSIGPLQGLHAHALNPWMNLLG